MTRRLPWKKTEAAEAASPSSLKQQRESPRQASIKREAPVASSPLTQTRLPVTPRKKRVTDRGEVFRLGYLFKVLRGLHADGRWLIRFHEESIDFTTTGAAKRRVRAP